MVWVLVVVNLLATGPSWELRGVFETFEACNVLLAKVKADTDGKFAVNTTAFCIQTDKVDKQDIPAAK